MKKTTKQRDPQEVRETIAALQNFGETFTHIHSKYTDTIINGQEQVKWITKERSDKVFIAYKMIERDLKINPLAKLANNGTYRTENYSNNQFEDDFYYDKVINLDVTSCYPYTAYLKKMICRNTLDFLMMLDKTDRLPALGMLAYNRFYYEYLNGELQSVNQVSGPWARIFYFIIETVNKLFLDLKEIAGDYYILHWVDGIFLKPDIPKKILSEINNRIIQEGYVLRNENCEKFSYKRDGVTIRVSMEKNGEKKEYAFEDANYTDYAREMARVLHAFRETEN